MDDARRRLDAADRLLRDPDLDNDEGVWPRACNWLIRLAVEHALDGYWAITRPEVASASRHAQLLALTRSVDADLGQRATALWHALRHHRRRIDQDLAPRPSFMIQETGSSAPAVWQSPRDCASCARRGVRPGQVMATGLPRWIGRHRRTRPVRSLCPTARRPRD